MSLIPRPEARPFETGEQWRIVYSIDHLAGSPQFAVHSVGEREIVRLVDRVPLTCPRKRCLQDGDHSNGV